MNIAISDIAALGADPGHADGIAQWPRGARRYVTALLAHVTLAPYGEPESTLLSYKAWLIVQRRGPDGSTLCIGFAGEDNVNGRKAPLRLRAVTTRTARLFSENETTAEFLFNRGLPQGEMVDGAFEPCEGYARIEAMGRGLRLTAFGRLANQVIRQGGSAVLAETASPLAHEGLSWRIQAMRKPLAGEIIGV
jgi:hypothetical protein